MIFIVIAALAFLFLPFLRCLVFNLHNVCIYSVKDIYCYIKNREWKIWKGYGLNIYVGLFGKGKTLSATHEVYRICKKFDYVKVLTNVDLPLLSPDRVECLVNYQQIIDCEENTIILIDEISTLFNSRAFKDFPVDLLFQILQCRKNKKQLIATAQRFGHVDKLMRDITAYVIDCNKIWRFQGNKYYDAWDYENCPNKKMIQSTKSSWFFVKDRDYQGYDTNLIIKKDDFISNEEILIKRQPSATDIFNSNLSKKGKKIIGK